MLSKTIFSCLLIVCLFSACAGSSYSSVTLTPYQTKTVSAAVVASGATETPLPAPTPTPRYHDVAAGETLSGIALQYGINLGDLIAANPDISPNAMSIGTRLLIPHASATNISGSAEPVDLQMELPNCTPTREGGAWCFLLLRNTQSKPVENLVARIILADPQGSTLLEQRTTSPLDHLPPSSSMPLLAYFSPPVPNPFQSSAELLSAYLVEDGNARYLDVSLENLTTEISADGLSARVSGDLLLPASSAPARRVWLAAVAYDAEGRVVGVRRHESAQSLLAGGRLSFDFFVYSTGELIASLDVLAEALK